MLRILQLHTIKRKLAALTVLSSFVALVPVYIGLRVYELRSTREDLSKDMVALAAVIADYAKAPLVFSHQDETREALSVLGNRSDVLGACIYSADSAIFAQYQRPDTTAVFPRFPEETGYRFEEDRFVLFQAIAYPNDPREGTLCIITDLSEVYLAPRNHFIIFVLSLPIPFLIAVFLSTSLHGRISGPITHLAAVAKKVTERRDYSLRASIHGRGELGTLIGGFNDMLAQIQKRDWELQAAHDELEQRVQDRVRDLEEEMSERKRAEDRERKLQEKLARSERMESLGILAGGVAHDLNNILGPIVAYPDLILAELPEDSNVRRDLLAIRESAIRAAAVIQDLLTLARRGSYQREIISLNEVVDACLKSPGFKEKLVHHPDTRLVTNLEKSDVSFMGSMPHLTQVVLNLVLNGMEAMPEGGPLKVETASETITQQITAHHSHIPPGDYVVLHVSDRGKGINSDDLEHIFEPFYTKKQMGMSGTGLGLAVVYGVVTDHQGYIDVQTLPGEGTRISLYFPAEADEEITPEPGDNDYRGTESILVVDDDESQRTLATRLLAHLGYVVHTTDNGRNAVRMVQERDFDLVVLDMIMEDDMDGLATYREILERRPGQRCVIASGYSETERVREAQELGSSMYVPKPFTLDEIGKAIRRALDAAEEAMG